jgi:hypothetical protein
MYHALNRLKIHTKFWLEELKGRDHMQDLGTDGNNIRLDLAEVG